MVSWQDLSGEFDGLRTPPGVVARPVGLAALGSESYFIEPYKIRSAHRIHIGRRVRIGEQSFLSVIEDFRGGQHHESTLRIGDDCLIGPYLHLVCALSVEIGAGVGIGARVFIGDSFYDYEDPAVAAVDMPISKPAPVRICDGAAIGIGSIVLPGVTIGERAVVAPGSVVTGDVAPGSAVTGNPARLVR